MSERDRNYWYYNINGHEHGPVMGSRLRQMARRGKLVSSDLIRQGKFGQWVEAGSVDEVGARPLAVVAAETSPETPVKSVANVQPNRFAEWLDECKDRISDGFSDLRQAVIDRLDLLRTVANYLALMAIVAFFAFRTIDCGAFQRTSIADPLTTFQSVWNKLQKLRQSKADPNLWSEFASASRAELKPIISRLERVAGATDRDAQLLLWAGRDCLMKMLDDARTEPSSSERQFAEYIENVELLRQGKPIYGGDLGGISTRQLKTGNVEWVVALLAVGIVLGGWIVLRLVKRRKSIS
jgi:hypothetical protein